LVPVQVRRLLAVAAVVKLCQVLLNFPSSRPFNADVPLPSLGFGFFYTLNMRAPSTDQWPDD
jgi:hypothetical protein